MAKDSLKKINEQFAHDPAFHHLSSANYVAGEGPSPDPALMLIGEAPGKHEDELQRPFVGQSGNMLESAMFYAGLKRADVYITNVVKFRPPNNRTPTQLEVADALPYLRREVLTVYPNGGTVVLLGSVALSLVDDDMKVTKVHGQPFTRAKWTFVPMFHPSYVLQRRVNREVWVEDWKRIKELIGR